MTRRGCCSSAILDNNPVCVFEHRWLMKKDGVVPEGFYRVPIGKGIYRRRGSDVTIVGASHAIELGMQAASALAAEGIDAEVIDLRTIKPLDEAIILESLHKTGRIVVVDTAWMKGGLCAEIGCLAAEKGFRDLKAPVVPHRAARHADARGLHARAVLLSRCRAHRAPPRAASSRVLIDMFYELASTSWGQEELDAIARVVRRGPLHDGRAACAGSKQAFAAKFGAKHAVMVNSGFVGESRRRRRALPRAATGRCSAATK